jgi:hypothetical protein
MSLSHLRSWTKPRARFNRAFRDHGHSQAATGNRFKEMLEMRRSLIVVRRAVRLALPAHAEGQKKAQHGGTENDGEQGKKIFHGMLLPDVRIARADGGREAGQDLSPREQSGLAPLFGTTRPA